MRILISAQSSAAGAIKGVAGDMEGLKKAAMGATAILVGVGVAIGLSVKAAADFQQGITTLKTGAGELDKNLAMVSQGILNMSVATGTSTKQLTDGLFMIESAGYRGSDGLRVLQAAAEGAKVGQADLGTVANVVTTIMKDYDMKSQQAGDAMNFLTAIVQNGKVHMEDLAGSMSTVLPTASAVGVKLIDVGAAMATMTGEGVGAAQAATYLRQLLISLAAPASAGAKALTAIGLTTQQVSDTMKKSLPDALKLIMTHLQETYKVGSPEYVAALKAIAGGSRQMQGMLDLTGVHLQDFQKNMKNVSGVMNEGKNSIVGWSDVQKDFNFKADQAKQALNAMAISLGTLLLPMLTNLLQAITPIVTAFSTWLQSILQNKTALAIIGGVLAGLAVIILSAVVPSIIAFGASLLSAEIMGAPLIAIVLAVIAVVTLVILAIQHWGDIVNWLKGVWSAVSGFFVGLWNGIKNVFMTAINAIVSFFVNIWTGVSNFFIGIWNGIKAFFTAIWNAIKTAAQIAFALIAAVILAPFVPLIAWIKSNWTAISAFLTALWNTIKAVASAVWNAISAVISAVTTTIRNIVTSVWNAISSFLGGLWNGIKNTAISIWNGITSAISSVITGFQNWIAGVWNAIKNTALGVWQGMVNAIGGIWQGIVAVVKAPINWVIGLINGMIDRVNSITGVVGIAPIGHIGYLASGIESFSGGLAYVHAGEVLTYLPKGASVVPANRVTMVQGGAGRAGGGPMTVNNTFYVQQLTQQEMDRAVKYMGDRLRAQFGNI